jgi:hypothetical protein
MTPALPRLIVHSFEFKRSHKLRHELRGEQGRIIASAWGEGEADEIARRCNNHDDLLAALDVIAHAAEVGGISAGERKGLAMAAKIASAAIAKAES